MNKCPVHKVALSSADDAEITDCFSVPTVNFCPLSECRYIYVPPKIGQASKIFKATFVSMAWFVADHTKRTKTMGDGK